MFNFFKKTKLKQPPFKTPGYFSKALHHILVRLNGWLSRQEKKYSIRQKKIMLLISCSLIAAIHFFNIYQATRPSTNNSWLPKSHHIATPQDITLPDSLDIELIRLRRELKGKQDSLTSINKK
jgi:hypothetical protein